MVGALRIPLLGKAGDDQVIAQDPYPKLADLVILRDVLHDRNKAKDIPYTGRRYGRIRSRVAYYLCAALFQHGSPMSSVLLTSIDAPSFILTFWENVSALILALRDLWEKPCSR